MASSILKCFMSDLKKKILIFYLNFGNFFSLAEKEKPIKGQTPTIWPKFQLSWIVVQTGHINYPFFNKHKLINFGLKRIQ